MNTPETARWSEGGRPQNVEAAIADALEWMNQLHTRIVASGRYPENSQKLERAISELANYGDDETRKRFHTEGSHAA